MEHHPWSRPLVAALVAFAAAPIATARTDILSAVNTQEQSFTRADGPQLLDLGTASGTSLSVPAVFPRRLAIFFSAECAVAAADDVWLSVDVMVDGIEVAPSNGTDDALCAGYGGGLDRASMASRDVVVDVPAGDHQVSIRAQLGPGSQSTDSWRLDDMSLIVIADDD